MQIRSEKIISFVFTAALCAAVFCGCDNGNKSSSSLSSTTVTSGTSSSLSSSESTTSRSETSGKSESSSGDASLTSLAASDGSTDHDVKSLAKLITGTGQWPMMAEITDETSLKDDYGIDVNDKKYDSFSVYKCPMSSTISEVMVIKPVDGEMDYAMEFLNDRKDKLINKFAYYPSDKEMAEAAKVGKQGEYAYLICATEAENADKALLDELK